MEVGWLDLLSDLPERPVSFQGKKRSGMQASALVRRYYGRGDVRGDVLYLSVFVRCCWFESERALIFLNSDKVFDGSGTTELKVHQAINVTM